MDTPRPYRKSVFPSSLSRVLRRRRLDAAASHSSRPRGPTEVRTPPPPPDGGRTGRVPPLPENGGIAAGTYLVPATGFAVPFEITVQTDGLAPTAKVWPRTTRITRMNGESLWVGGPPNMFRRTHARGWTRSSRSVHRLRYSLTRSRRRRQRRALLPSRSCWAITPA